MLETLQQAGAKAGWRENRRAGSEGAFFDAKVEKGSLHFDETASCVACFQQPNSVTEQDVLDGLADATVRPGPHI